MFPVYSGDDIDAAGDPDFALDFGDMGQADAAASNGATTYKIFVGGLPPNTSDEMLRGSFFGFGVVLNVEVKRDSLTGRTRGFGFVEFQDEASVDAVMANFATNMVAGKWVECKRAVPRGSGPGPGPASMGRSRPSQQPSIRPIYPTSAPLQCRNFGVADSAGKRPSLALPSTGTPSDCTKIFVGGLPHNCSAEQLTAYFGQYGNITGIEVKVDPSTGRTRGFGFVQFDNPESVNVVLEHFAGHVIEGKWVEVKRAVGKEAGGGSISAPSVTMSVGSSTQSWLGGGDALDRLMSRAPSHQGKGAPPQALPSFAGGAPAEGSSQEGDKIFVGGLPLNTPDEVLIQYFSQFGAIVAAEVKKEKETGRTRGFGFMQFEDPASVTMVMQNYESHSIDGKWVEVKRAVPPQKTAEGAGTPPVVMSWEQNDDPRPKTHALTRPGDTLAAYASSPGYGCSTSYQAYTNNPGASHSSSGGWGKGAQRSSQPGSDAVEQPNKVFVGGLPMDSRADMLQAYFGQYGGIVSAEVKTDPGTGRTRGFGFVEFEDPLSAALVLANNNGHMIEGKFVEVKPAVGHPGGKGGLGSQTVAGAGNQDFTGGHVYDANAVQTLLTQLQAAPAPSHAPVGGDSDKIFVGGLPPNTPDEVLVEYFSQYGVVTSAEVKKDIATGQTRGFGFVHFNDSSSVDLVMVNYDSHSLGGKWIEVKRTLPRGAAPPAGKGGGKGPPPAQGGGFHAYSKGGDMPIMRTDRAFRIKPY